MGPKGGSVLKNLPANSGDRRQGFNSCVRKIPWSRKWQPTPVFLPGKFMNRGTWQATVHEIPKSRTQLSMHACMPENI